MKSSDAKVLVAAATCTATQSPVIALLSRKFAMERGCAFIFSDTDISSPLSPGFPYLIPGLAVALEARKILYPAPGYPSLSLSSFPWSRMEAKLLLMLARTAPSTTDAHTMQTRTSSRGARYREMRT